MDINTKLSIGEYIFIIWQNTEEKTVTCDVCKGECEINISEKKFICPECYGSGTRTIIEPQCWRIAENKYTSFNKIHRIDIEVTKKETKIAYFPWGNSGNYFYEKDCFKTLEEAQNECDDRNKNENIEKSK